MKPNSEEESVTRVNMFQTPWLFILTSPYSFLLAAQNIKKMFMTQYNNVSLFMYLS